MTINYTHYVKNSGTSNRSSFMLNAVDAMTKYATLRANDVLNIYAMKIIKATLSSSFLPWTFAENVTLL